MKIAVCGTSIGDIKEDILKMAFQIGAEIAGKGHTLIFGACPGYPYEAAKGAFSNKGHIIGISPAKDEKEHIGKYRFPIEPITQIEFTGLGIPGRNLPLIAKSDAAVFISGGIGTLNEFTLAFHLKKLIGILIGSGGITDIAQRVVEICDNENYNMKGKVFFSNNPIDLIEKFTIDI